MKYNRQIQHAYRIQLDNQVEQKRRLKTEPVSVSTTATHRTITQPQHLKQRLYQDYFLQILRDQKQKQQHYLNSVFKNCLRQSTARRRIISEKQPSKYLNNNNLYFSNRIAESIRNNKRVIQQQYKSVLDRQIEQKQQKSKQQQIDHKSLGRRVRHHDPILNPVGYQVWSKQLKTFISPYSFQ